MIFWIFSDEIYAELIYDMKFTSIASLKGMKERTVVLSGFSKAYNYDRIGLVIYVDQRIL